MPKIVIDIPEEFVEHFNQDRFEDALHRLNADAHLLAGNYEQETAKMLINAFQNSIVLPKGHGRLIDADKLPIEDLGVTTGTTEGSIDNAPTIVEADKE